MDELPDRGGPSGPGLIACLPARAAAVKAGGASRRPQGRSEAEGLDGPGLCRLSSTRPGPGSAHDGAPQYTSAGVR